MVWECTLSFLSKTFPPWHGMLLKERLFATPPHSHETTNRSVYRNICNYFSSFCNYFSSSTTLNIIYVRQALDCGWPKNYRTQLQIPNFEPAPKGLFLITGLELDLCGLRNDLLRDRSIYMIGRFICELFTNGWPPSTPPIRELWNITTYIFDWSKS